MSWRAFVPVSRASFSMLSELLRARTGCSRPRQPLIPSSPSGLRSLRCPLGLRPSCRIRCAVCQELELKRRMADSPWRFWTPCVQCAGRISTRDATASSAQPPASGNQALAKIELARVRTATNASCRHGVIPAFSALPIGAFELVLHMKNHTPAMPTSVDRRTESANRP